MFGLQVWILMSFELKACLIVMPQPGKNTVNTMVFIIFQICVSFLNLMILGPDLDLISVTFEDPGAPIWRHLG
jgi:hypothetical protein